MHRILPVWSMAALALSSIAAVAAQEEEESDCGMYLAISSTSTVDETRWGIYAGHDIPKNSPLGGPDIAINIFNLQGNTQLAEAQTAEVDNLLSSTVDFFEQFIWVPVPSGGQFELEEGRTVTAIPGAGVLGGFNPKLTNADWNHSSAFFRPSLGEEPGVNHPGRGAYSNFYNVALRSKDEIAAGREIFLEVRLWTRSIYQCCLQYCSPNAGLLYRYIVRRQLGRGSQGRRPHNGRFPKA
jgi:hypothetical protein